MAKILVDENVLIQLAEKFHRAGALFDVIEDEIPHIERAHRLAAVGFNMTLDAAGEIEALYGKNGCSHE
ncbi:hypothetical protein [Burkholderia gladioli]|uniref:hypothetical protein n=1 Tax=Burkholderia gladioli TaxID=28095 RepID=UPI00163F7EB8|nr:hypothetical protein [Burkholderia gladioli]